MKQADLLLVGVTCPARPEQMCTGVDGSTLVRLLK